MLLWSQGFPYSASRTWPLATRMSNKGRKSGSSSRTWSKTLAL